MTTTIKHQNDHDTIVRYHSSSSYYTLMITTVNQHHHKTNTWSSWSSYLHYHDHHRIPGSPPYRYTVRFIIIPTLWWSPPYTLGWSPPYLHFDDHRHTYTLMITAIPTLWWSPPYTWGHVHREAYTTLTTTTAKCWRPPYCLPFPLWQPVSGRHGARGSWHGLSQHTPLQQLPLQQVSDAAQQVSPQQISDAAQQV